MDSSLPNPTSNKTPQDVSWVDAGDFELNFAGVCGAPTLRPSPGLEQRLALDLSGDQEQPPTLKLGVHLHAFYLEEAQHVVNRLRQALPQSDLLITTDTTAKKEAIEEFLDGFEAAPWQGRLEVRVVPNLGRNILPLLRDGLIALQHCELLLHLHTKRTIHKSFGSDWLNDLLTCLIGNTSRVNAMMHAFREDPELGLVMPQPSAVIRPYLNWGANFDIACLLVRALWPQRQLHAQAPLVFPPGMMFWCRPKALEPLRDVLTTLEPFPLEPLLHDGTPLHALERLTAHACEVAGHRWALADIPRNQGEAREQSGTTTGRGRPHLSVWEPQPEAYLEGVAALTERHRRLQTSLDERSRQFEAILEHRDRLEVSLAERDRGLAERDAALEECHRALQQAYGMEDSPPPGRPEERRDGLKSIFFGTDNSLARSRQELLDHQRIQRQELEAIKRELGSLRTNFEAWEKSRAAQDASAQESSQDIMNSQRTHLQKLQTILEQCHSLEQMLESHEQRLTERQHTLEASRHEILTNQTIQGQQLQSIIAQGAQLELSLESCQANVRHILEEQLAIRKTLVWRAMDKIRRLKTKLSLQSSKSEPPPA